MVLPVYLTNRLWVTVVKEFCVDSLETVKFTGAEVDPDQGHLRKQDSVFELFKEPRKAFTWTSRKIIGHYKWYRLRYLLRYVQRWRNFHVTSENIALQQIILGISQILLGLLWKHHRGISKAEKILKCEKIIFKD